MQKIHNIFHFKKEGIFYKEIILEGLLISIGLHAIFNIILEMNLNFLIVPFLVAGYKTLNYLFNKKENHKNYGKVLAYIRNHPHPKTGVYFTRKSLNKDEV